MPISSMKRIAWMAIHLLVVFASGGFALRQRSFDFNSLVALGRGGASKASSWIETSVGIFLVGNRFEEVPDSLSWLIDADVSCGVNSVVLLGKGPESNIIPLARVSEFPQNYAAKRTVGLLSDTIVVVLLGGEDQYAASLQELNEDLRKIVQERQTRSLPKGRIVVVANTASYSSFLDNIAQQQLSSFNPSLWDSFDVVKPDNLQRQHVSVLLSESIGTVEMLLPDERSPDSFARLFKEVYMFKGGDMTSNPFCRVVSIADDTTYGNSTSDKDKKYLSTEASLEISSNSAGIDDQDKIESALTGARKELSELECKMQEIQLDSTSNNPVPLFEFGERSNAILITVSRELSFLPISLQAGIMRGLVEEVHRLFNDQIQALRDYYGRRYEGSLEVQEDEAKWAAEAEHVAGGFKAAADHAIPALCQSGGVLAGTIKFDYLEALQGLLQDMMEATQGRKDQLGLIDDDEQPDEPQIRSHNVPKWLKKLAARAFVLGVNYVQGWLAWQGIKRAAMERDREMPKFPLF